MKKIIIAIVSIVAVACLGIGGFLVFSNVGKTSTATEALEQAMNNFLPDSEKLASFASPTKKLFDGVYKVTTDSKLNIGDQKMSLNGDVYVDGANQKYYLDSTYDFGGSAMGLEAYFEKTTMYFKVKDVFSRFYSINLTDVFTSSDTDEMNELLEVFEKIEFTPEQMGKLSELIKKSVLDNIKDNDFKKKEEKLTFDGKEISTTKYSLGITEKLCKDILLSFMEGLKNDKELVGAFQTMIDSFASYFEENGSLDGASSDKVDFTAMLDEAIKSLNEEEAGKEIVADFVMYLNKKDIVRYELVVKATDKDSSDVTIRINTYENKKGFNNFEFVVLNGTSEVVNVKLEGTSKTKKDLTMSVMGEKILTGSMEFSDKKTEFTLKSDAIGLDMNYLYEVVSEGKEYKLNLSFALDYEDTKVNITSNNTLKTEEKLPDVDISNSTSYENMTEEELQALQAIFQKLDLI